MDLLVSQSRTTTWLDPRTEHNLHWPECTFLEYSGLCPNKLVAHVPGFVGLEFSFTKQTFGRNLTTIAVRLFFYSLFLFLVINDIGRHIKDTDLTMSTALARTLGSLPVTETDAVKEPSILNTTHSVFGGTTASEKSTAVWSPLKPSNSCQHINRKKF